MSGIKMHVIIFDKLLRQSERSYRQAVAEGIESTTTSNPTDFWDKIKNLGPRKDKTILVQVHDTNGQHHIGWKQGLQGMENRFSELIWTASSEFGTYRLCEQRRFRRACASVQSRQNLRCSLIQAVSQEEPSDRKPDPWPLWMAGHAQLKFVMTECSKTQIRLTRLI